MKKSRRILVLSTDFNCGPVRGIHYGYLQHPAVEESFLLLLTSGSDHSVRYGCDNEFFLDTGDRINFWPLLDTQTSIRANFLKFLEIIKPDVVHAHLTFGFNYALLEYVRQFNPNMQIFLTVHDYDAICPLSPFMLTPKGKCCIEPRLTECAKCMPTFTPTEQWLRKRRFMHFLELADGIITPSNFMQNRFFEYGCDPNKLYTLENCFPDMPIFYPLARQRQYDKFGYFGPVCPYSGLQAVLGALANLPMELQAKIHMHVHTSGFEEQPQAFKDEINSYRDRLKTSGTLVWQEDFSPKTLSKNIAEMDWIIVPSLWGESSPEIIRRAKRIGLPVVCAAHASLAEKVGHDIDGVLVGGDSPLSGWEDMFRITPKNDRFWKRLSRDTRCPDDKKIVEEHLHLLGVLNDPWDQDL